MFEGRHAHIKSLFQHNAAEVQSKLSEIAIESYQIQDSLLQQEMQRLKVQV